MTIGDPKKAYLDQKFHAHSRGIEWEFKYSEWLEMWLISGRWFDRGKGSDQYCMARYGDTGPYNKRNCRITTTEENQKDRRKFDHKGLVEAYLYTDLSQKEVGIIFNCDQSYVSKVVKRFKNGE